jgi:hypothetical protein
MAFRRIRQPRDTRQNEKIIQNLFVTIIHLNPTKACTRSQKPAAFGPGDAQRYISINNSKKVLFMNNFSYSKHIDTLTALTSYLAMTDRKSLTPTHLSDALSLDIKEVSYVLENFKSLFRRSQRLSPKNRENYYTLHLRYGLRGQGNGENCDDDIARKPLGHEYLSSLLNFISRKADSEHEEKRLKSNIKFNLFSAWGTAIVAAIIAIASMTSNYFIQKNNIHFQKHIKQYEVSFKPKQIGYSNFMGGLYEAYQSAYQKNREELNSNLKGIENSFYSIELFFSETERDDVWNEILNYTGFCLSLFEVSHEDKNQLSGFSSSFNTYKNSFRNKLLYSLFEEKTKYNKANAADTKSCTAD